MLTKSTTSDSFLANAPLFSNLGPSLLEDPGSILRFAFIAEFKLLLFIFTFLVFALNLPFLLLILLLSFASKASSSSGKPDLAPFTKDSLRALR